MIPVLVLCDDYWHPAEVIERGFRGIKQELFSFDFVTAPKDILTPEMIKAFPVIANCKTDMINAANKAPWFEPGVTEVCVEEFDTYVREGGGFLSLHAANTAKEKTGYGLFVKNIFIGHPPRCTVDVKISGSHPIVKGVRDFSIRDEHYQIECFADESALLFQTVSESGGVQTGGYAMERGKGRICVMTPGHILSVWQHPAWQQLLINALLWCARS
jgi:type 1 glutamine amidotransferase